MKSLRQPLTENKGSTELWPNLREVGTKDGCRYSGLYLPRVSQPDTIFWNVSKSDSQQRGYPPDIRYHIRTVSPRTSHQLCHDGILHRCHSDLSSRVCTSRTSWLDLGDSPISNCVWPASCVAHQFRHPKYRRRHILENSDMYV